MREQRKRKNKLLVILGPTSSGKSKLAVKLALQFSGEVVSADSRQVYQDLDIATGKITKEETEGVPHHLLSIVSPKEVYTIANYKKDAEQAIEEIHAKENLPILCGGTGFYIQSVVDNITYPEVPPNENLRKDLEKKETDELFQILETKDRKRAKTIDPQNRIRMIRAIEIASALGKVPPPQDAQEKYEVLQIGLQIPDKILKEHVQRRTEDRFKQGMIQEAQRLLDHGLTLERMKMLGLEYRILANFLEKRITKNEVREKIISGNWQYARRQRTWFARDPRILWIAYDDCEKASKLVNAFLHKEQ